jgi:hemoglobin
MALSKGAGAGRFLGLKLFTLRRRSASANARSSFWRKAMSRFKKAAIAASLLIPFLAPAALAEDKSLYVRLGGYDAIAAVTGDFIGRLATNEKLSRFFVGFSTDSKLRIQQDVIDLICQQSGGPCLYTGRDMKTTHAGIGISKEEWDISVVAFVETMKKLNLPEQEQKDLAALILPLEKDIVEKP